MADVSSCVGGSHARSGSAPALPSHLFRPRACSDNGWSTFAYSTWSARQLARQVSTLTSQRDEGIADRNEVRAKFEQLQRARGGRRKVEGKLNGGNAELTRKVRAWAAAEQKLATLNKRLEGTKD